MLLVSYYCSNKVARQRPYDLFAGMVFFETAFEINLMVWAGLDYPRTGLFGFITQITLCSMLHMFGSIAHDMVQQVRNPFKRQLNLRLAFMLVFWVFFYTAIFKEFAVAIVDDEADEFYEGYGMFLFPWVSRRFTHIWSTQHHKIRKTTLTERYFGLFCVFIFPLLFNCVYAVYAYMLGRRGLSQGLDFISDARKRLFDFRRDFLLGNTMFFIFFLALAVFVNLSGRCVDYSGITMVGCLHLIHALFHFALWVVYVPGMYRYVLQKIVLRIRSATGEIEEADEEADEQVRQKLCCGSQGGVVTELNPIGDPASHDGCASEQKQDLNEPSTITSPRNFRRAHPRVDESEPGDDDVVLQLDPSRPASPAPAAGRCTKDTRCTDIRCPDYSRNYGRHKHLNETGKDKREEQAARGDDFFLRAEVVHLMSDGIKRAVSFI